MAWPRRPTSAPASAAPAPLRGRPTLEHVAKLAGVSTATISRALNTPDLVAPETRARVQQAVAATGYVPNLLAGGLASNRSRLIAALVPGIATSPFNETIEAMSRELAAAGYLVVLGLEPGDDPVALDGAITALLSRRPDGLILTGSVRDAGVRRRVLAAGVTIIETWDLPLRPLDVAIGFSHRDAGRAVAGLVFDRGYRRPLIITSSFPRARARMAGFIAEAQARGLPEPACDIAPAGAYIVDGRARLAANLDARARPDVVICSSDLVAQGAMAEAAARGLKVPADLAFVGFGGSESSAFTYPALTTVRIDGHAIGRQAAQVLIGRSEGREPARRRIDVGFELVIRGTT